MGLIINLLFWAGILVGFCGVCSLIGILIVSFRLSKGQKDGIWITEIKKAKRDFIEKGI